MAPRERVHGAAYDVTKVFGRRRLFNRDVVAIRTENSPKKKQKKKTKVKVYE